VSIVVALRQTTTRAEVSAVHDAVRTSDGRTIGEMVEAADLTAGTPPITPPAP
jgi:hypothetical protein